MKRKAIKVTKEQKIAFMQKHRKLDKTKLVKLIRKKFGYSDKTYNVDILASFMHASRKEHHIHTV